MMALSSSSSVRSSSSRHHGGCPFGGIHLLTMSDYLEFGKVIGVNTGVFAAVSLTDAEILLKVIALALTCVWTAVKIYKLIKND